MTLYTLLVLLCIGSECREVQVPVGDTQSACILTAQAIVAQMALPAHVAMAWRCEAGERA